MIYLYLIDYLFISYRLESSNLILSYGRLILLFFSKDKSIQETASLIIMKPTWKKGLN